MEVLTLHAQQVAEYARRLKEIALAGAPAGFDVIVGIRRGGAFVAREMIDTERYVEVGLSRPGTGRKKGLVGRILPYLPTCVLDLLRKIESRVLAKTGGEVPPFKLEKGLLDGAERVLVVDDAVDSGRTMAAVLRAIRRDYPRASVSTAALTITTPRPLLLPDFYLFNNQTLLRFPWSSDYKPKK